MSPAEIEDAREALERFAREIARLEPIVEGRDAPHAQTLAAIKSSIEALNTEALRRLIRYLQEHPAAAARLAQPQQESWIWMCTLGSIPDGGVKKITHWGRNFLLHRRGDSVSCMTNACSHRGMAIDSGKVGNGVITCPYHDYEFDLLTGRCLNVAEDPLTMHAVRVNDGHVEMRWPL